MRCIPPLLASLALLVSACGGAPQTSERGTRIGMSGDDTSGSGGAAASAPPAVAGSVELALRLPDGAFIDVGELRGRPVMLFLFATFDAVSQMMLRPLEAFHAAHPEVDLIGVATQPDARLLIDAYVHALSPSFPVAYDPEESLPGDDTVLGPIEAIPALVLLDARGVLVARRYGFVEPPDIEAMLGAAH